MFGQIGSVEAIGKVDDNKKVQHEPEQNHVAFVNSIFDNFGGNSQGSTETAFNA